jgi:uncharacterized protein (DUF1800 family)
MRPLLEQLDPRWAWSTYEPDETRPWTQREAAHLLRRATFGASWKEIKDATRGTPAELVRELVRDRRDSPATEQTFADLTHYVIASGKPENLPVWWLRRLAESRDQLREKMTLFWHGHFATGAEKVRDVRMMLRQNELFRTHAMRRFGPLVHEISKDPAMLIYLDSATNRKSHPNENYAREVMELFCLGEGHYSEEDVRALARCFTGWEIRNQQFGFNRYQHDGGEKTILGRSGNFGGEEGIEMILEQPACPRFLVRKLMRYFLFDEPVIPDSLVIPLADRFRSTDYDIGQLLEQMLSSNLFFSEHCFGKKVRSPVEFTLGILRGLESQADSFLLRDELIHLGQSLFYPPNVKGWEGGRTWINSSTLLARANLVRKLVDAGRGRFAAGELTRLASTYGVTSSEQLVDWLLELLVAVSVPGIVRKRLAELADRERDRPGEVVHALATLPEFQIG